MFFDQKSPKHTDFFLGGRDGHNCTFYQSWYFLIVSLQANIGKTLFDQVPGTALHCSALYCIASLHIEYWRGLFIQCSSKANIGKHSMQTSSECSCIGNKNKACIQLLHETCILHTRSIQITYKLCIYSYQYNFFKFCYIVGSKYYIVDSRGYPKDTLYI